MKSTKAENVSNLVRVRTLKKKNGKEHYLKLERKVKVNENSMQEREFLQLIIQSLPIQTYAAQHLAIES